ncbi:VOC family protein [Mesonia sp.]|uniref:VOC family protein n=1 Tax=Mesonia sp. TaxID=1960830 RepID=UPI003F9E89A7
MRKVPPFHLAIPVDDLQKARVFYTKTLHFKEGRSSDHWVDYDFFGHQLVIHLDEGEHRASTQSSIDGKNVPVPHFGVVLPWEIFESFADQLKQRDVQFEIEPYIRFKGKTGEQMTMFFYDPCGNALEFKAFKDPGQLFAS